MEVAPGLHAEGPCETTAASLAGASEHDRVPQVERRVQGPAILGSTLSASTSRVTSVPVPRPSRGSTLVSGHGDSSMGSFSPPTYGHTAVGGQQRQVARVDSHGASSPCLG